MPIRPQSKPAQVDSPAKIIRVRGVAVSGGTENRRLKWDGEAYTETQDVIEFFPDSGDTARELEEDEEAMCVWMPAAARWEEFSGGGSASIRFARVTTEVTAAISPLTADWGTGQVKLQDDETGVVDTTATDVNNLMIDVTYPIDSQVQVDMAYTPPRVLNGTCDAVAWGD